MTVFCGGKTWTYGSSLSEIGHAIGQAKGVSRTLHYPAHVVGEHGIVMTFVRGQRLERKR